jgi:C1A family cysteine protease
LKFQGILFLSVDHKVAVRVNILQIEEEKMLTNYQRFHAMGYLPDFPSIRDYNIYTDEVNDERRVLSEEPVNFMLSKAGVAEVPQRLPLETDLRPWFSLIEDQENIGSCTAQAGIGLLEYFEKKAFGSYIDASRLFLYKVTRKLAHLEGDSGAYLRTTMEALVAFGAPPEEYWPYVTAEFDQEPSAFCYAFGQNYKAITYYRLDPAGTATSDLLARIKTNLAADLPSMFGFTVHDSIRQAEKNEGKVPFPCRGDRVVGGHAVVAVGYDDGLVIQNTRPGAEPTKGALLIRNSWGTNWGSKGYGWLPYDYVLKGLAIDWWSVLKTAWIDTGEFKLS